MDISFDPAKREWTLEHRGLDFADAERVFAGPGIMVEDDRRDYGEDRYVTYGRLGDRLVAIVWTPRDDVRHVISMRKANEREQRRYGPRLA
ncbi:MAG TPA: BrnT family toxin [Allosphingosinicella sp.]|nr:BrnT family toxin [Allosphingosinicella sp.]